MDRLWAPWRMPYITSIDKGDEGCIFCNKPKEENDEKNLILYRSTHCFVILNLFPYNTGHLMVVPYTHVCDLKSLNREEKTNLMEMVEASLAVLESVLHPEGFNVGLNLGRVSGAGIDQHLHMHIVPRWNGDTNFMPILGHTKVISESLQETRKHLSQAFREQFE